METYCLLHYANVTVHCSSNNLQHVTEFSMKNFNDNHDSEQWRESKMMNCIANNEISKANHGVPNDELNSGKSLNYELIF